MAKKTAAFRKRRAADMRACRKRQNAGIALFYVAADETIFEMMKRFGGLDPNRVRLGEHGIDIVDGRPIRPPPAALYWVGAGAPSRAASAGQKNQEFRHPVGQSKIESAVMARPAPVAGRSTMSEDLVYTEPAYAERTAITTRANGQDTDENGWERWLRGHLDIERQVILDGVTEAVGDVLAQRDR